MASNKYSITLEIAPIVKLLCLKRECPYNMMNNAAERGVHCSLKWVEIDESGKCRMEKLYEKGTEDESV